jgi:hypothetical protein
MKKALILGYVVLAAPLAFAGGPEVKSGTKGDKPYFEASDTVTKQATVLAVDAKTRVVKLATAAGDTTDVVAGDEVKNFAQIKPKDLVTITYTTRFTIHVEAPGTPEVTTEKMTAAAKPGDKPSGSVTERTTFKATITAIDKVHGTATLKGYDGEEFTVTPRHPENLDKVSVGEMVVFTTTEMVAAAVEKVEAKPVTKR